MFTLFLQFHNTDPAARIAAVDLERVRRLAGSVERARKVLVMTPAQARDRYNSQDPVPVLGIQAYFDTIEDAESALTAHAPLAGITAETLPSLAGAVASQQVMVARGYAVPEGAEPERDFSCAYMVHYPGHAQDLNAWLGYYIAHHPVIMARFPGIIGIEICTRTDWVDTAPWPRAEHMQRNKVVFASSEALEAALNSPVRDEMRADFHDFPPFEGGAIHVPMLCERVVG
ncbi:hypothetical protein MTR62_07020 [Novosphingobium sp. 1949]|uniref:Ethyl tert-butyl ether degradation EthD n=1 Tax=Novosphingobium organovorum TaxID=2930092 RepID=A0ABT0BBL1_9SPHN|nr:hypothetical protein [Novosphingobium organovorum]MCJ2182451.1 hypothetical protein [Novosphingobium organovorum]